ncbi:MAG: 16S rRNA (guanine(527)-N(7))-methyltransferase RsmG [Gammaproteobacteria bacterium]|jgi:16S rRNA (guanine527-N7)-methyltransferase|uniref:16S rRNA (guanine(527)-N(7))-methyltransferase RsmG n=1 Tax=Acidiferrobacter sp. SPIII_3 TaxID=1281578 RepID=UPI000D73628A|nr:16S rRNA (guanine(527)-N(7))-methyltransferase RsmG [Acidiferrobacter sp. SPIII_3]AWP24815.1 16S rRNA (guanine(527)-N(7))-methyltransferase RsmG [Acidiferrobacter sp. SPIII_3]MDA8118564.1 16S rRNA (guanine(527)-N(7))-methyltransferase RsmG [Gammaproteobacteria bacterium]
MGGARAMGAEPWGRARERLRVGMQALGLTADAPTQARLLSYLETLARWNRVFNLTAIRDPEDMVARHILDSLTILPHLPAGRLLDIGSGAGLPGIPIAVLQPQRPVVLLDRSRKRMDFLTEVVARMALTQVVLAHGRVEDHVPEAPYAVITARAFASLDDIALAAGRLLAPGGIIAAMKGALPTEELASVAPPFTVQAVHALQVPGLAAKRHLVALVRDP